MADSMRYANWFEKARAEFKSAEILLKHSGDNAVISFLCQRTIEKAYKGFILKHKEELITSINNNTLHKQRKNVLCG